jgi:hypothetical protein
MLPVCQDTLYGAERESANAAAGAASGRFVGDRFLSSRVQFVTILDLVPPPADGIQPTPTGSRTTRGRPRGEGHPPPSGRLHCWHSRAAGGVGASESPRR